MNDPELRRWAKRMKTALEAIVEGLSRVRRPRAGDPGLSADDVMAIARRALNPDDWERAT
jgi:hypothetical protein